MQGQMSLFDSYDYFNRTSQDSADGLLYGNIGITINEDGSKEGIDGNQFARELDNLLANGVRKINVRINSFGGSVIDGYSIYSAIQNANELGARVDTYNEWVAASIAGIIAMAGKTRYTYDYSIFMIHDPSFGLENMSEKDKEVLGKIKNSLIKVLSNSSTVTPELIDGMMTEETWLDADAAGPEGHKFFDKILPTGKKGVIQKEVYSKYQEVYNKFLIDTKPKNVMEENKNKIIQAVDNTELDSAKAELEKLKTEKEELAKKVAEMEAAQKAADTAKATELVETFVQEGLIPEEQKAESVELAMNNYEGFKKLVNGFKVKKAIHIPRNQAVNGKEEEMNFSELSKKDPKFLADLQKNDPQKFQEIYNKTYKIK